MNDNQIKRQLLYKVKLSTFLIILSIIYKHNNFTKFKPLTSYNLIFFQHNKNNNFKINIDNL